MSYQNINQYVYKKIDLKPFGSITDISLASDEEDYNEEVVFSDKIIGYNNGNRLPFNFEFDDIQTLNCINCGVFSADTIVSKNYWNPDNTDLTNCRTTFSICDVGLTGIDNGLVSSFSGESISIFDGLFSSDEDKFNRYKYDKRMKLHPITGFTTSENRIFNDNSYDYNIEIITDDDYVGNYANLKGGFYQGFYKLFGYDYEVYPERPNKGWTAEFLLRPRFLEYEATGLNVRYPQNKGTFFYWGTRAEDKFYHAATGETPNYSGYNRITSGLTCLNTCDCSNGSSSYNCSKVYPDSTIFKEKDPLFDSLSNGFSLRLSGDDGNPKLCVKSYTITGSCEHNGDCVDSNYNFITGATITEWCSTTGIFEDFENTFFVLRENWVQIDAVFNRDLYLDDCDTKLFGGLDSIHEKIYKSSLLNESEDLISPPTTHTDTYNPDYIDKYTLNNKWLAESEYRKGTLKIYINGKPFMVIDDFEEVIPRPLDSDKNTQIGVPYNISVGGGTQGLHDSLIPIDCENLIYTQNPETSTTNILNNTEYSGLTTSVFIEENFGGSFFGDLSAFRLYSEPLDASQIRHNFKIQQEKYRLVDPLIPECDAILTQLPTRTPTTTPTPSYVTCDFEVSAIGRAYSCDFDVLVEVFL